MFYSQFILAKKGPLGTIWIAAHLERKLRKNQVADTDIGVSVDSILFPEVPIALRLSSHLLLGVVRIYSRKVNYLFDDCSEALLKVKQAFRSTAVDLPPEESTAPYHSITLPETFDLDDFELPDNDIFQGNYVDHHVSTREQITLQDTIDGMVYSTSQFGLDERFGDGDASQIGLDLDEDLLVDKVTATKDGVSDADPQGSVKLVTPWKQDNVSEHMNETSEARTVNDSANQLERLGLDSEPIEFAEAPSTPGLVQEPNLCSGPKALASDDHFESEDHNSNELTAAESRVNAVSQTDCHHGDSHAAEWPLHKGSNDDIVHCMLPEENGCHIRDAEIKQVQSLGDSVKSMPLAPIDGPEGTINQLDGSNRLENVQNATSMLSGKSQRAESDKTAASLSCTNLTCDSICETCPGSTDMPVSEDHLVDDQASIKAKTHNDAELTDNIAGSGSLVVVDAEVRVLEPKDHETLNNHLAHEEMASVDLNVLKPCSSHLSEHDMSSPGHDNSVARNLQSVQVEPHSSETSRRNQISVEVQGEDWHVTNIMQSEKTQISVPSVRGDTQEANRTLDKPLDDAISSDHQLKELNDSMSSDMPAPEKLLSVPEGLLDKPNDLLVASSSGNSASGGKKNETLNKMDGVGDNASNFVSGGQSKEQSPNSLAKSRLQTGESSAEAAAQCETSRGHTGSLRSSDVCTPETSFDCENPKESESPRFQALLRLTSAPRKRFPADVKSFSHELNSKGVRPFPFWKPRGLNNLEEILVVIRTKFDKAKEEVNSDLAIFAGDLVGVLEKNAENHPEWQETIEDLLVLARRCAMTSPGEFWLECEGIVQELDDRRQELPPGTLKQLYTRMLFILTRCTRLWQFHKESGLAEDEHVFQLRQSRVLHSADKGIPQVVGRDGKGSTVAKASKVPSSRKSYSQEQHGLDWKRDHAILQGNILSPRDDNAKSLESPGARNRMASWKKLPSPIGKTVKETPTLKEQSDSKVETLKRSNNRRGFSELDLTAKPLEFPPALETLEHSSKHQHKISWGYWGDQQNIFDDNSSIICRICEEEVPTSNVEDHSIICAIADRCDQKGLTVNERLLRISETLEKMMESSAQKDIHNVAVGSPDVAKVSNSSMTEESDVLSPKFSDCSRRGSEDMLDYVPEADNSVSMDDLKGLPSMSCKTRFGPKSDQGMTTSSAGSMTPRSPLLTPTTSQIDLLLAGKGALSEHDDFPQMNELADIARCVATTPLDDDRSITYFLSCLEDLRVVIDHRKFDALTVETFGARIEKLIREKYLQLCELVTDDKVDITSTVIDEDAPLEDDVVRSLRTSPIHPSKDRTSIDDFEIIKPISRGAFGRVFLAKKRTTGDLFAIKVLKKADMIRKNAVESILAERDILISVRNPFVVRFFYSFTCRENLYLVMEYLNGGDLYSLLRNLGCLDEDVARVYIAEVVLALEYLHSLCVVHRDLKPDNLLIAHDGHIKLTDFGLSKVGLINSTDDLSGPAVSGTTLLGDEEPQLNASEHQQERRKKRSAVGTPDYLAPEILLGTGHGTTADWWSVGIILFELIVGIPPFNAEHPQQIFDNILNRKIHWPQVSEEMSPEAQDLIDRLLTEDPHQRLGAGGASEVKQHRFFKDVNWDTLARQKAAFVPTSESALDTSYFTSRHSWNPSDENVYPACEFEDASDVDSLSGSSSCLSNRQDEVGDECGGLAGFESGSSVNYSFSNFSFKNLSQLASINYDLLSKGWKDDPPRNPKT